MVQSGRQPGEYRWRPGVRVDTLMWVGTIAFAAGISVGWALALAWAEHGPAPRDGE